MTTNINFIKRFSTICCLVFMLTGCYTAQKAFNPGYKSPVYVKGYNSGNSQFYVDGVATELKDTKYSRTKIAETSTTITYLDKYLPALNAKANKSYVTIKQVNISSGKTETYLLKSNTVPGYKLIMYFQAMFTGGIGNIIDFATNSIYAWPVLKATN